ncbi:MAG: sulfotransferase, partial [Candidatus Limnocylindrales bacterium]
MSTAARLRQVAVRGARTVRRWRGHRPPGPGAPPATPSGWVTAAPDFVGIGAQKAGTSWWSALIHEHPDVHRAGSQPKELHFFDAFWETPFADLDSARYARYFPRPPGGRAGEWTPGYMIDFWTPALIAKSAPEAKILVLLRDPVERYRSSMVHTSEMSRSSLSRLDAMGAFQRGLYSQQLRRVFAAFPRDRVLILQYE